MEQDNNESVQQNMTANENIDDTSNKTDEELEVNQNTSNEEYEYDSEKERLEYRLAHPDSDSKYSNSDESIESIFERWHNNRSTHRYETYSE